MLKSMNDWYPEVMADFTHRSLCSECEGMHSRFGGKGGGLPLAVNSSAHVGSLSCCAHLHTQPCLKIFAYAPWQARKQGAHLVASRFN